MLAVNASKSRTSTNPLRIELPAPHKAQRQVLDEQTRFNVLACGRRWGKTALLTNVILPPAIEGKPVAWFAPNSKLFDEVWSEVNRRLPSGLVSRSDSQKNRIELITGGVLDFWTLHNTDDPGRGRKYATVAIDEAAMAHRLETQWTEAIRPTLTDFEGTAWFASTPKGANYFKTLHDRASEQGWARWQMPTTANPHINPLEVEAARKELPPLVFAQEYLAQFVTEFGAHFKPPTRYEPSELPKDGFREATGCDFAYTSKSGDFTVFVRGRVHSDVLYITDCYRRQAGVTEWMERLRLEPDPFAFIGGQEKGITDLLRQNGLRIGVERAVSDKLARAHPAIAMWNRGDIRVPTQAPWLDDFLPEILSFTGDPRIDAHDDVVDALAALHDKLMGRRITTRATAESIYR